MKTWSYNPHTGGKKIQPALHGDIYEKVKEYSHKRPWYPKIKLQIRFKNQFCYIDTISEGDERIFPLCRLRNLSEGWSLALFTYSNERYEPCIYPSGQWEGTIEEALRVCEPFII
jgi:hypothetical protein